MLWLTGLMGVLVVGAVAFLDLSPAETDEEAAPSGLDDFISEHPFDYLSYEQAPSGFETGGEAGLDPEAGPMPVVYDSAAGTGQDVPELTDFDAEQDDLVLVWDDSTDEEPDLRLAPSETAPESLELSIGDVVMARVPASSGLTTDHVALLPQSAAEALGWVEGGGGHET